MTSPLFELPLSGRSIVIASWLVFACILPQMRVSAQSSSAQIPARPLTQEQVAVYQAFLGNYRRGDKLQTINVAEVTEILQPDEGDYSGCMRSFPKFSPVGSVRRLTEDFAEQNRLRIVDPRVHKIEDPEAGMRKGLSVESAVEAGFTSGVLTFSEIIFDANHKRAALHYSLICGGLCAHFETVVYEKRHGVWNRSKRSCGYGIS